MPCLAIYGSTGRGKTRIIPKFLRDSRAHFDRKLGRTRLPVVSLQMPTTPYPRDLYEGILAARGGVFAPGAGATPCAIGFAPWPTSWSAQVDY
jgi:hypothetical protein